MFKLLLSVAGLAALGGVVGYLQWLCPDGSCALTGSWWGGATAGGLLGFALHEGFMARGPVGSGRPVEGDVPRDEPPTSASGQDR